MLGYGLRLRRQRRSEDSLPREVSNDLFVDTLALRGALVGDGVVLTEPSEGGLVLYAVDAGRAELMGSFDHASDAWSAVDALDVPWHTHEPAQAVPNH